MKELLFSITKKDLQIEFFSGTGAGETLEERVETMMHPDNLKIEYKDRDKNMWAEVME